MVKCNRTIEDEFEADSVTYDQLSKVYTIVGQSDAGKCSTTSTGCPVFQISEIWLIFERHSIMLSLLSVLCGVAQTFYGRRLLSPTLFIVGYQTITNPRYLVAFMIMLVGLTEFVISPNTTPIVIWMIMAVTILIGVFIGFISMKLPRFGIACAGIWLAFIITLLL